MMNTKRAPFLVVENESFAINCFAALKDLDSFQQLDRYLYNRIVSDALYDPEIHNLVYACEQGYLSVVQYLVEGGEYNRDDCCDGLHRATKNGHLDIVKYLAEQGANIHDDCDVAFLSASGRGYLKIVEYFVDQRAVDIHVCEPFS